MPVEHTTSCESAPRHEVVRPSLGDSWMMHHGGSDDHILYWHVLAQWQRVIHETNVLHVMDSIHIFEATRTRFGEVDTGRAYEPRRRDDDAFLDRIFVDEAAFLGWADRIAERHSPALPTRKQAKRAEREKRGGARTTQRQHRGSRANKRR